MDFHDIPVVDRPCYVEMKQFIDNEGQFCPFTLAINGVRRPGASPGGQVRFDSVA